MLLSHICVYFSDKSKSSSTAVDGSSSLDGSHSHALHDSVSVDSAVQLNASVHLPPDDQTLGSNADNALATNHISTDAEQKTSHSKSTKSRPTCLLCNKSFHTRYKLNEHHAVVHLDKRLFSCNVCQKTFGRADHLIRHVRNRVCFQRQQIPEFVDSSGRPGNPDGILSCTDILVSF